MLRTLGIGFLVLALPICACANDSGYARCNCDDEGSSWTLETIVEGQKVSDFMIAVAYFSIPIELLYFVSCSNVPFKWVLFEFIAFIVLCGMTHLLNGWTYGPHSFQLMMALTVFKFLTALVSCATAITLLTLIPLLLKVKVREFMLKKKTWDLGREVGMIMKKQEASLHVRMLTQEIRKSLDRHTILYTTLVELSKTLGLQNCAVWMPNEYRTEMSLTHELNGRNYKHTIPTTDPDVKRIKGSDSVNIIKHDSPIAAASTRESGEPGPVAAIRMPILRVCNFKGGTPELIQACYAILILILPGGHPRTWSSQELEIIKVVADQVAVALSHAAILEESQFMREKLEEQNRTLQQAKLNAMMASQARNSFQKAMSDGMRRPMHSIMGLVSIMQVDNLNSEQRVIVDAMLRTSSVLSTLINDAMDSSIKDDGRFPLEMHSFSLHSIIKEAAYLSKCLCVYKGLGFAIEVEKHLPDNVMGDERRVFQVILHMVGNLLESNHGVGTVVLKVLSDRGSQDKNEHRWTARKQGFPDGNICVRFQLEMDSNSAKLDSGFGGGQLGSGFYAYDRVEGGLSFSVCKRIVQLMQGNMWATYNPEGFPKSMTVVLRFQSRSSITIAIPVPEESSERSDSNSLFRGLLVLLADYDGMNRAVTQKLLEKLGCHVTCVASGVECLTVISGAGSTIQVVLLDLHMPELDSYDVASRIRKFRSRRTPVILALTSNADEDVWERCMDGVIRKPVQLQGIAIELRRVLVQSYKFQRGRDSY